MSVPGCRCQLCLAERRKELLWEWKVLGGFFGCLLLAYLLRFFVVR